MLSVAGYAFDHMEISGVFNMKVKGQGAFWRGFGSVLTAQPHRGIEAKVAADPSAEAAKMIARAWDNVGSHLKGAMDGFENGKQSPRVK